MPPLNPEQQAMKIASIKKTHCKCGAKMEITKTSLAGTAVDLTCTNPKCMKAYHIPLTDRDQLPAPGSGHQFQKANQYTPTKEYRCRSCQTSIPEDQAIRTFKEMGTALCNVCEEN